MNYILIMTEGSDEKELLDILLERNLLKFAKKELLMEEIFHARQIDTNIRAYIQGLRPGNDVTIYRVGDKLSDNLTIPKTIMPNKIKTKYKVCTLPEFEILMILNDKYYDRYIKEKSNLKPSEFYKKVNKNFSKSREFVHSYFNSLTDDELVDLLNLYYKKRGRMHKKDELSLKDLLK